MTLAWDLLVWLAVAVLLLGVRLLADVVRRRGYDEGFSDAAEPLASASRTDGEPPETG